MTANAKNGFLLSNGHWQNHYLNNPVSIVVVNLMPTKETTERQFLESFNRLTHHVELTFFIRQLTTSKTFPSQRSLKLTSA